MESKVIIKNKIYAPVKILDYDMPYSRLFHKSFNVIIAQIYEGFMRKIGFKSRLVEVFPLISKKQELMNDPTKFYLMEIPEPIFRFDKKTERLKPEEVIIAPYEWFDYNLLQDPVEAILKSIDFFDISGIKI